MKSSESIFYLEDVEADDEALRRLRNLNDKITNMIEFDISLSYKILKMVNTFAYYTRVKVTSIQQAIVILGLNELKK
ncbi:hypothetical protein BKP35_08380 [Anaerobacillus arseniciselenatis]|uniref:HDOD domain-containing protein n=1 Tax=Anaerobacillus arseniciselenatis TaxID=85682 RepID=A0A1S2LQ31_9BACI|nr:hypothetical protein BKP35_08380 [Anaerobacillus arseniciselenatis]